MHPVRARLVMLLLLLALVAGCTSAPFAAQSPPRAARIGFLGGGSPGGPLAAAFVAGLGEHGWVEGQNLTVDYRFAEGKPDRLPGLARELVELEPVAIFASGEPSVEAALQATAEVPIVMAV